MADTQVLFWLLIIGVLFYLYIDVRMAQIKDEMKLNLLILERLVRSSLPQSDKQTQALALSTTPSVYPSEWQSPPTVTESFGSSGCAPLTNTVNEQNGAKRTSVFMMDDLLPSREELEREVGVSLSQSVQGVKPTFDSFDPMGSSSFAPVPANYGK